MLTALLVVALLPLVGTLRTAAQVLVAWIVGARPVHVILGIGPGLARRRVAGMPVELRLLPLGGHVQWGETPYPIPPPGPWGSRFVLALSGPLSTLFVAFAVSFGLHVAFQARTLNGETVPTRIVKVPFGAAVSAGLRAGDVLVEVDGQTVEYFDEISRLVGRSEGRPLQIGVQRLPPAADPAVMGVTGTLGGRQVLGPLVDERWQALTLEVSPEPTAEGYRLGVEPKVAQLGADSWLEAVTFASLETASSLRRLFEPRPVAEPVQPVAGDFAAPLMHLLISVALALFVINLLLPAHDLHRLALLLLEVVVRRPVSPRAEIVWVRVEVLLALSALVLFLAWYVVRALAP